LGRDGWIVRISAVIDFEDDGFDAESLGLRAAQTVPPINGRGSVGHCRGC
jgi:hypothetical protein